jgi:hypothetical protein
MRIRYVELRKNKIRRPSKNVSLPLCSEYAFLEKYSDMPRSGNEFGSLSTEQYLIKPKQRN